VKNFVYVGWGVVCGVARKHIDSNVLDFVHFFNDEIGKCIGEFDGVLRDRGSSGPGRML
jgi:hypothetical protein